MNMFSIIESGAKYTKYIVLAFQPVSQFTELARNLKHNHKSVWRNVTCMAGLTGGAVGGGIMGPNLPTIGPWATEQVTFLLNSLNIDGPGVVGFSDAAVAFMSAWVLSQVGLSFTKNGCRYVNERILKLPANSAYHLSDKKINSVVEKLQNKYPQLVDINAEWLRDVSNYLVKQIQKYKKSGRKSKRTKYKELFEDLITGINVGPLKRHFASKKRILKDKVKEEQELLNLGDSEEATLKLRRAAADRLKACRADTNFYYKSKEVPAYGNTGQDRMQRALNMSLGEITDQLESMHNKNLKHIRRYNRYTLPLGIELVDPLAALEEGRASESYDESLAGTRTRSRSPSPFR